VLKRCWATPGTNNLCSPIVSFFNISVELSDLELKNSFFLVATFTAVRVSNSSSRCRFQARQVKRLRSDHLETGTRHTSFRLAFNEKTGPRQKCETVHVHDYTLCFCVSKTKRKPSSFAPG